MHIAIIGFGSIGRRHAANAKACGCFDRISIVSRSAPQEHGQPFVYRALDELPVAPDMAVIATAASERLPLIQRLAEWRPGLLIEKPLALSRTEAELIVDIVDARGMKAIVGYNLRFLAPLQAIKATLADGRLGDAIHAKISVGSNLSRWRPGRSIADTVTGRVDLGGGALFELSHELDYAMYLFGRPISSVSYVVRSGRFADGIDDIVDVIAEMPGDASAVRVILHLDLHDWKSHRSCRIVGTLGTLEWEGGSSVEITSQDGTETCWSGPPLSEEIPRTYESELTTLVEAVIHQTSPYGCSVEEAAAVIRWIEELKASRRTSTELRSGG